MGDKETVSIVIATHNRPLLLEKTLDSVVTQTSCGEIIVLNDGGIDVSEITSNYEVPIVLINQKKNKGPASALNTAIHAARGHYISICDDDDIFTPDHTDTLKSYLKNHKECELVYSSTYAFSDEPSNIIGKMDTGFNPKKLYETNFIPPSSTLFTKSLYERVGGFDESLPGYWDWDFFLKASKYTDIQHVDQFLTFYRVHEQSFQRTQEKTELEKMIKVLSTRHNLSQIDVKNLFENFEVL